MEKDVAPESWACSTNKGLQDPRRTKRGCSPSNFFHNQDIRWRIMLRKLSLIVLQRSKES